MPVPSDKSVELRFRFGQNWANYLSVVDEDRIAEATQRLSEMLGSLRGKSFLDVGSGSGIQSLAAVRLGAARVHSFDFDGQSVACSQEMKRRFAPAANWHIEQGSILDEEYVRSLGTFDVVYSWGVLHHTGAMWKALEMAIVPAQETLMIAIYADQGLVSRAWDRLKRMYVHYPVTRPAVTLVSLATLWGPKLLLRPHRIGQDWKTWQKRGMSPWHDVIDWAGGYPYEFSTPEKIAGFARQHGFQVVRIERFGRIITCYEYVLSRTAGPTSGNTVKNSSFR
jgi:2-polyprenyl-6-hydroxyphenyl methylase/3-demethylubiquinone-9 3-methyltransferase